MQLERRQGIIQAKSTDMDIRQIKVTHTDQTSSLVRVINRANESSWPKHLILECYIRNPRDQNLYKHQTSISADLASPKGCFEGGSSGTL